MPPSLCLIARDMCGCIRYKLYIMVYLSNSSGNHVSAYSVCIVKMTLALSSGHINCAAFTNQCISCVTTWKFVLMCWPIDLACMQCWMHQEEWSLCIMFSVWWTASSFLWKRLHRTPCLYDVAIWASAANTSKWSVIFALDMEVVKSQ
jgi:hypothetical protein